jgi:hypothetical protein
VFGASKIAPGNFVKPDPAAAGFGFSSHHPKLKSPLAGGFKFGAGDGNRTHVVSLGILSIQQPTTNSNSNNSKLLDSV